MILFCLFRHLHSVQLALHDGQQRQRGVLLLCRGAELGLCAAQRHALGLHHDGHLVILHHRSGPVAQARHVAACLHKKIM
jgi:hypothetical protein